VPPSATTGPAAIASAARFGTSLAWATPRTDPSGTEVTERFQEIEGALHVVLNALEWLAPNEQALERYRRWMDALTAVHAEVLDDFLALSTGHSDLD
jgi:hypothetical protein